MEEWFKGLRVWTVVAQTYSSQPSGPPRKQENFGFCPGNQPSNKNKRVVQVLEFISHLISWPTSPTLCWVFKRVGIFGLLDPPRGVTRPGTFLNLNHFKKF